MIYLLSLLIEIIIVTLWSLKIECFLFKATDKICAV